MATQGYEELVVEAFIKPIRSVLIVDDDYPTFHEILLDEDKRSDRLKSKTWNLNSESRSKVRKVIDEFRRPDAPYLLDIHDGSSPSEETDERQVRWLQQTDLLILDYQLDKQKVSDGAAAIRIAAETLTNKHFNLVLVHTQEPLDRVFHEFLVGFMTPLFSIQDLREPNARLQAFLNKEEARLTAAVTSALYVEARRLWEKGPPELRDAIQREGGRLAPVRDVLVNGGVSRGDWNDALLYALTAFEIEGSDRFAAESAGVMDWREEEPKFIRASRGFVAFKSKEDPRELMPVMTDALNAWSPLPSRLMLTKLRAEMNERGIEVQDDALGRMDVGAVWYLDILKGAERDLDSIVDRTVRNHSEQLLDQLLPEVCEFTKRIRLVDSGSDPLAAVHGRFGLDLADPANLSDAKFGHNAFVGSKPSRSAHLELGHIFSIDGTYWVCLTPACDMVPTVHRGKPFDRIDGVKRFTAVKLIERAAKDILRDANRGGQVFVNVRGGSAPAQPMAFSIAPQIGASPSWMTMYVSNDGYLDASNGLSCTVRFVSKPGEEDEQGVPVIRKAEAVVRGMLRYEYALEIQSRFIASQSRIGLDFMHVDEAGNEADG